MNRRLSYLFILVFLNSGQLCAQAPAASDDFWAISERGSIVLDLAIFTHLPHSDHIEMAGRKVAAIINYAIDEDKNLTLEKDIIFPQLRTFNKSNEPDWKKYRAYFRRQLDDATTPIISYQDQLIVPAQVDSIEIGGMITFYYTPVQGVKISRRIYPSMDDRLLVEEWQVVNRGEEPKMITISPVAYEQTEAGYKGTYSIIARSAAVEEITLSPGKAYVFPMYYGALLNGERPEAFDFLKARESRQAFLALCRNQLVLQTPDPVVNTLFYFSKIRAAESIFDSSMGLVHSPGGGNYYVGVWANDQIEYSGPFFPYLGYETAEIAAFNAYRKFLNELPEEDSHIAYAFEVDGHFPMTHLDRGDAAMLAYGTSLYLLNQGELEQAKELWPLIEWSLAYCHDHRNDQGAVLSESDEMEGRIPTGDANLSTSSLYYGGLKFSIPLAHALRMPEKAAQYEERLAAMEQVIEQYFGANLEGLDTYRYFEGHPYLRHWICLPLTMGITKRKEGTLAALFDKLWTDDGILVEYNPEAEVKEPVFWDRATLYALRGALQAGELELAMDKLRQYSGHRLLGDHVPYAVEAYPENNMKHLSAESALYCRIYLEGLLGIEPRDLNTIKMRPQLPDDWDFLELDAIHLFGQPYDIKISRSGEQLRLVIGSGAEVFFDEMIDPLETVYLNK